MLTNYTPSLDAQKATRDRLIYIYMDTNFTEKPKNKNDIKIDNEFSEKVENEYLSEMFSWIVQGSKEYYKNCKIEMTQEFKERTNEILTGSDSILNFFERLVTKTNNIKDFIKCSDLFVNYMKFCNKNSQRCQPRSSLFNRIEEYGAIKSKLKGYDGYRYIEVKDLDLIEIEDEESLIDKIPKKILTEEEVLELELLQLI
jgi:hypothetical protein